MFFRKPTIDSFIRSPNQRPARREKVSAIVIHHTGTMTDSIPWLTNPDSKVSYHYVIDRAGEITQLVNDNGEAWHAGHGELFGDGNANHYSIGVGLVGDGNKYEYTDKQLTSLEHLTAWLAHTHLVQLNRIVGHQDVDHKRKVDPGEHFDWDEFLLHIAIIRASMIFQEGLKPNET